MNLKPGTRCECTEDHHTVNGCGSVCLQSAVRLVLVREPAVYRFQIASGITETLTDVPMCAACAEYHEKKGA